MKISVLESDVDGGWTGSVPSSNPTPPQSASIFINNGSWELDTIGTFLGAPTNMPFILCYGTVNIKNSTLVATNVNSSATLYSYVIVTSGNSVSVENSIFQYNSLYNGAFGDINTDNNSFIVQTFKNIAYADNNTGTPVKPVYNINWGSNVTWESVISVQPFFDNQGRYFGGFPPSITNPPISGTVYQNQNPFDIEIDLPVYATTSGTAGYVTIAKGTSSTPTAIGNQYVNGATSSASTNIIKLRVPAGWYYKFTASGVTFGTATVFVD